MKAQINITQEKTKDQKIRDLEEENDKLKKELREKKAKKKLWKDVLNK